jgi:hypothetical protein
MGVFNRTCIFIFDERECLNIEKGIFFMEAQDYVLALKQLKLTQVQISEGTGIPQPTISKIERGCVSDVMSRHYRALQSFHEKLVAARSTKNSDAEIAGLAVTQGAKPVTPRDTLNAAGTVSAATEAGAKTAGSSSRPRWFISINGAGKAPISPRPVPRVLQTCTAVLIVTTTTKESLKMEQSPNKDLSDIHTRPEECSTHGAFEARRLFGKIFTRCPACTEASRLADEQREAAEQKAREEAQQTRRRDACRAASGLVGRQFRCSFDNYGTFTTQQAAILADCRAYVNQFQKGQPRPKNSLWLLGIPGTGKSHLGAAMVNHLIDTVGTTARMHSTQEIIRLLRATWGREKDAPTQTYEENEDGSGVRLG